MFDGKLSNWPWSFTKSLINNYIHFNLINLNYQLGQAGINQLGGVFVNGRPQSKLCSTDNSRIGHDGRSAM